MKSFVLGIRVSITAAMLLAAFAGGCDSSQEGDRCNPSLSNDECNSGLVCGIPTGCDPSQPGASPYANGEAYCCPANGVSTNPNCDGSCNPCQFAASLVDPPAFCLEGGVPPPEPEAGADAGGE